MPTPQFPLGAGLAEIATSSRARYPRFHLKVGARVATFSLSEGREYISESISNSIERRAQLEWYNNSYVTVAFAPIVQYDTNPSFSSPYNANDASKMQNFQVIMEVTTLKILPGKFSRSMPELLIIRVLLPTRNLVLTLLPRRD